MYLPTKFDPKTNIPDNCIESILGETIYRITNCVQQYGLKEGYILMWREKDNIYVIYRFLDDAIHTCFATHSTYGYNDIHAEAGELAVLDRFIAESTDMVYLLLDWKAMTPRERERYEADCLEIAQSLGRVIDEDKRKVKAWMEQAVSVIDSKGRENIGRTRTLQSSAAQVGDRRRGSVMDISERVDRRKAALVRERQINLSALRTARELLQSISEDMETTLRVRHGLMERLSQVPPILRATHDRPWRRAFRHSADDIEKAIAAINSADMEGARRRVRIAKISLQGLGEVHLLISDYRLRLAMALERRPRRPSELKYLFHELTGIRLSFNEAEHPHDPLYRTKLLDRIRGELDVAIAEWNRGAFDEVRSRLAATADGA